MELKKLDEVVQAIDDLLKQEIFSEQVMPDYLSHAVEAYPKRGGKRMRPALTVWFCGLAGGEPSDALEAGLAIELFHNWTLIHDDIIDNDGTRRNGPSCHALVERYLDEKLPERESDTACKGESFAILAGDILHAWAVNVLARASLEKQSPRIWSLLVERLSGWVTPQLISGEGLDVEFEARRDVKPDELEEMLCLKTGVLLQFAAEAGTRIGGKIQELDSSLVRSAMEYGWKAGVAFQLQDDVLGIFAEEEELGKPVCSDVRAGKPTLLLSDALQHADAAARKRLEGLMGSDELTDEDVATIREIVTQSGAQERVNARAAELVAEAKEELRPFPDNPYKEILEALADKMISRTK